MAFPSSPVLNFARAASEQEARLLASKLVLPEHLFLALLWPEASSGPTVLSAYGITVQRARVAMHEMATWGGEPLRGALPVAVATERAYEIAERYAEDQPVQHSDLLIGVLSVAAPALERLLLKLGVSRSHLRAAVQQTEARQSSARPRRRTAVQRIDAAPPPSPAPDVIDLRPAVARPAITLPGSVGPSAPSPGVLGAPDALELRVGELSLRVDALIAQVERLLAEPANR